MSESKANLEQILELLLAEENDQAEELLHEYVVAKARQQYERVLDESEEVEEDLEESEEVDESSCNNKDEGKEIDEEVEETIDQSDPAESYIQDVADIQGAVKADKFGEADDEDGGEMDGDMEDKLDDLEDELADLKAEFEKLMANDDEAEDDADDAMDAAADADADEIEFDQQEMESVEYDLDEDFEDSLEEATKFSDNVADPKAPPSDNNASPFTQAPMETKVEGAGEPVHSKDGGEGDHGDSANANPQDPGNHNIDVEQKQQ